MILQCPNCNSRFLVADALIPPAGREVRCGACHHQWHVQLATGGAAPAAEHAPVDFAQLVSEATESAEIETPPLAAPGTRLPAVTYQWPRTRPFKIVSMVLAASWLVALLIGNYPGWIDVPIVTQLYAVAGIVDTDGLAFDEVKMDRIEKGSQTQFIIAGNIVNRSAAPRRLPTVRVELKNKKGDVFWARAYPVNHLFAAGESYPFRITNVETSFARDASAIVLDLGHSLQLAMRQ